MTKHATGKIADSRCQETFGTSSAYGQDNEGKERATEILQAADEVEADLIVMPTAGRGGVFDVLRGSTTERVLRRAPCPLLAVPARDNG